MPEDRRGDSIQVSDILVWSIRETWNMLQRGVQLWATQGRRYEKHRRLWNEFTGGQRALDAYHASQFLEDEAQTILERYRPKAPGKKAAAQDSEPGAVPDPISHRLRDFGVSSCDGAMLHEEQERELAPEIETERQTERPPAMAEEPHSIHPDVAAFATEGTIVPNSKGYRRAFATLSRTRAGSQFGVANLSPVIAPTFFATVDFARTVKSPGTRDAFEDSYLRSVQWVLVSRQAPSETVMLVISPYEANALMPKVAEGRKTTLHLYSPRVNPAYPSLDELTLFPYPRQQSDPISRQLRVALNLFAGQLYFNDYDMYVSTCKFLGLSWERAKEDEVLESDGFIAKDSEGRVGGGSGFTKSPVNFFRHLMIIRRDSQAISGTHVGDMLDNRPLPESTFLTEDGSTSGKTKKRRTTGAIQGVRKRTRRNVVRAKTGQKKEK